MRSSSNRSRRTNMLFLALLPFSVSATPAIQDAVASHFVHFSGGMSPLSLATGPLSLAALSTEVAGHFDTNLQKAQHELEEYKQKGQGLWHTFLQRVTSGRFYWAFMKELDTLEPAPADNPRARKYARRTHRYQHQPKVYAVSESEVHGELQKDDKLWIASASKLFIALGVMVSMHLHPWDWSPHKPIHEISDAPDWEWRDFKDFVVMDDAEVGPDGGAKKYDITLVQLLNHSSGLPFRLNTNREELQKETLFFRPGEGWGYSLGHRVAGWALRDYWAPIMREAGYRPSVEKAMASAKHGFHVLDVLKFLYLDKMELTQTSFREHTHTSCWIVGNIFGSHDKTAGEAGDANIMTTANDMEKVVTLMLRKGKLPDGTELIPEHKWEEWVFKNTLPKLTNDPSMLAWKGPSVLKDFFGSPMSGEARRNAVALSTMRQVGPFGWSMFAATYEQPTGKSYGWCGFFSSCMIADYAEEVGFVLAQQDNADRYGLKKYMNNTGMNDLARAVRAEK